MSGAPTKAELVERLNDAAVRNKLLADRLEGIDPEARAFNGCVKALAAIAPREPTTSGGFTVTSSNTSKAATVRRVLLTLADRYGVDLVTTVTEPCGREHLDDASDSDLLQRIRGW